MISLTFIRHGESEFNLQQHLVGGRTNDTPLSDRGKRQAEALGKRLAREEAQFERFYSSPAVRAYQTAQIVCGEMGYSSERITLDDRLLELGQGEWEGKPRTEVYTAETMAKIKTDSWTFCPPGGETQKGVAERMYDFIEAERASYTAGNSIIFSHGTAIKCLLKQVMDCNKKLAYYMPIDNASISEIKHHPDYKWCPTRINDGAHLHGVGKLEIPLMNKIKA